MILQMLLWPCGSAICHNGTDVIIPKELIKSDWAKLTKKDCQMLMDPKKKSWGELDFAMATAVTAIVYSVNAKKEGRQILEIKIKGMFLLSGLLWARVLWALRRHI